MHALRPHTPPAEKCFFCTAKPHKNRFNLFAPFGANSAKLFRQAEPPPGWAGAELLRKAVMVWQHTGRVWNPPLPVLNQHRREIGQRVGEPDPYDLAWDAPGFRRRGRVSRPAVRHPPQVKINHRTPSSQYSIGVRWLFFLNGLTPVTTYSSRPGPRSRNARF